jgi:ribosomal protein S18 acetylase RimI-like enzyme
LAYQSEARIHNDFSIPPLTQTIDEVREEFARGIFLKAVENEKIVGSVRAYIENETAYIGKLIVLPEKQNRGIGTKLLIAIARECPAPRYELFTSTKSAKNIKLYERLGYVKFREQKIAGELVFVFMEKRGFAISK